jgi:hypothetical protein
MHPLTSYSFAQKILGIVRAYRYERTKTMSSLIGVSITII